MSIAPPPIDPATQALFLDIDGSLLDLAPTPDAVIVPPCVPALLDSLAHRASGALALISGRSLADIDRLLPANRDAAGTHGAELRLPGMAAPSREDWSDDVTAAVEAGARALPGVLIERKSRSVALHFGAAPEHEAAARALAETVALAAPSPLRLVLGKAVVELVPSGVGKGPAIERFMRAAPYAGRVPVFVGDDLTDEDGFQAVNRMNGISIHVGSKPTAARFRVSTPAAVRRWLAGLDPSSGERVGT